MPGNMYRRKEATSIDITKSEGDFERARSNSISSAFVNCFMTFSCRTKNFPWRQEVFVNQFVWTEILALVSLIVFFFFTFWKVTFQAKFVRSLMTAQSICKRERWRAHPNWAGVFDLSYFYDVRCPLLLTWNINYKTQTSREIEWSYR